VETSYVGSLDTSQGEDATATNLLHKKLKSKKPLSFNLSTFVKKSFIQKKKITAYAFLSVHFSN
jgi:hypothetical protein